MSTFSNYVMLAYGITGSGKTYTLEGAPASPGVLPRALEHLFEVLQQHEDRDQLSVCISYYEIYNDHIYDLLLPPKGAAVHQRPMIRARSPITRRPLDVEMLCPDCEDDNCLSSAACSMNLTWDWTYLLNEGVITYISTLNSVDAL